METQEDPYKPHHNFAAAKELLNRGWAFPNAIECSWHCTHHVSAEYFNGHKSRNGHNGATPTQDAENSVPTPDAAEEDTAQPEVAVEESQDESREANPEPVEGSVEGDAPKKSFTDIDSLPEHFWMKVLDLCERTGREG